MKRRVFDSLAAFLAMMCVALIMLGVRSVWVPQTLFHTRTERPRWTIEWRAVHSQAGSLTFRFNRSWASEQGDQSGWIDIWEKTVPRQGWRLEKWDRGGLFDDSSLDWARPRVTSYRNPAYDNSTWSQWAIVIPYWLPILLTGAWPALRFGRRWRENGRRRRAARGLCVTCGYDLRATPERCPECGTAVGKGVGA